MCNLPGASTFARLNTILYLDAMHSSPILSRDVREGEGNIEIHDCITSCWAVTEHCLVSPDCTTSSRTNTDPNPIAKQITNKEIKNKPKKHKRNKKTALSTYTLPHIASMTATFNETICNVKSRFDFQLSRQSLFLEVPHLHRCQHHVTYTSHACSEWLKWQWSYFTGLQWTRLSDLHGSHTSLTVTWGRVDVKEW